ncbi:unnamed protein product [Rotaria sp. Silwood2]|nr:unnamed protein product [Rotaria sp. Silwood2]
MLNIDLLKEMTDQADYAEVQVPKKKTIDFAQVFSNTRQCSGLGLHCNMFDDDDMRAIGDQLKSCHSVTQLNLYSDRIGPCGAKYLADGLKENKFLTHLLMGENQLGDEGARHMADALKINETLGLLRLERNGIGHIGAQFIGEGLALNKVRLPNVIIDIMFLPADSWRIISSWKWYW